MGSFFEKTVTGRDAVDKVKDKNKMSISVDGMSEGFNVEYNQFVGIGIEEKESNGKTETHVVSCCNPRHLGPAYKSLASSLINIFKGLDPLEKVELCLYFWEVDEMIRKALRDDVDELLSNELTNEYNN